MEVECRICLSRVKRGHSTHMFARGNCLRKLIDIAINEDDGFPSYICRSCKHTVETTESKVEWFKKPTRAILVLAVLAESERNALAASLRQLQQQDHLQNDNSCLKWSCCCSCGHYDNAHILTLTHILTLH